MFTFIPHSSGPVKHCACPTGSRRLHTIRWQAHKNEEAAGLKLAYQHSLIQQRNKQRGWMQQAHSASIEQRQNCL